LATQSECQPTDQLKACTHGNQLGTRPVGRPKIRWEEDVKANIKKMKVPGQDRTKWKVRLRRPKLYVSCSVKVEETLHLHEAQAERFEFMKNISSHKAAKGYTNQHKSG
jgi:septation ring formation regulator EzrA